MSQSRQGPVRIVIAALAFIAPVVHAKEPPRIDGTSDSAFDQSFAKLVKSLNGYKPRELALGLFTVLLPQNCLSTDAVMYLTFKPVTPKDAPIIRSCRAYLDGKSYQDIINAADAKHREAAPASPDNAAKQG